MSEPRGRPFQPGNHFGKGRPRGSRNKSSRKILELLDRYSDPIIRRCVAEAVGGNVQAMKLCMAVLAPTRRDNPIRLTLPAVESASDRVAAGNEILKAVTTGKITPDQGAHLMTMLEKQGHVVETLDLSKRVNQLEQIADERSINKGF